VIARPGAAVPAGVPVLRLAPHDPLPTGARPRGARLRPDQLAYLLHTSGSTGSPKGVLIEHGAFINYMEWCLETYGLHEGNGTVVHSPVAFDLTLTSIFAPLLTGKPLYIAPEAEGLEGLFRALRATRDLTFLKLTPAHLEILAAVLTPEEMRDCTRVLILGGEALTYEALAAWRTHAPATRIINEYGPTETTVGCCVFEAGAGTETGPVPIGRPIQNTRLYMLDRHLSPAPIGVFGEIYIAGPSVGRGYHRAPAATARSFIPDPFSPTPGARMYRSGDAGRVLANGVIEYGGRDDGQVKIRAFRVELGDVEETLRRHPAVRAAVAAVRQTAGGQLQLVAYVVARNPPADTDALMAFLRQELADHLVPSAIMAMDALPLTPNGKVDRDALPAPEIRMALDRVAPRSEIERRLADIWKEVLGLDDVGIEETFFALGGTSLQLVRVHARLDETFGCTLPLTALFQFPTIASLARQLSGEHDATGETAILSRADRQLRAVSALRQAKTAKPPSGS
jgi:amino acid adenylation domain-containing protein